MEQQQVCSNEEGKKFQALQPASAVGSSDANVVEVASVVAYIGRFNLEQ